jgi:hypothetical protein
MMMMMMIVLVNFFVQDLNDVVRKVVGRFMNFFRRVHLQHHGGVV